MYLFQRTTIRESSAYIVIYIPLCIYFNVTDIRLVKPLSVYLHSTMYLFQLGQTVVGTPLLLVFTFHYVSISTDSGHSGGGGSSRFTFHYVSISTWKSTHND